MEGSKVKGIGDLRNLASILAMGFKVDMEMRDVRRLGKLGYG